MGYMLTLAPLAPRPILDLQLLGEPINEIPIKLFSGHAIPLDILSKKSIPGLDKISLDCFSGAVQSAASKQHESPMNPFEHYNIKHLSPSSCNLFIGSPAMYVLERVMGKKSKVGAAAHRGNAVEEGVVLGLMGASDAEAIKTAKSTFGRLTAFSGDPRREKESNSIEDMVKQGLAELRPYGTPSSTQGKIEWQVEGLMVPLIGFYDIAWDDHGILLDIKTTHALPSQIKINHARQVALYTAALGNNISPRLSYITTKKVATYTLENVEQHVHALERVALTIQKFLSISEDPNELASLVVPDIDSFYFSDPIVRQAAFEVWGL